MISFQNPDQLKHLSKLRRTMGLVVMLSSMFLASKVTFAQNNTHPGQAIYDNTCAACHNNPEATKSPALSTLKSMRSETLLYAIDKGKMQTQASTLSAQEKAVLVDFLAGNDDSTDQDWVSSMMCGTDHKAIDLSTPTVSTFGFNLSNHRQLNSTEAGLTTADLGELELAWAIGFPKATTMRSQAAVVGSTLFLPVAEANAVYAFDVSGSPCLRWIYQSAVPMRTSAAFGVLADGRKVIATADVASTVHLIDAKSGEKIWTQQVAINPLSITTGTPVVLKDKVIVPISQYEITVAGSSEHQCCTSHGAVTALNSLSGEKIWTMHTMEDAKPQRDRGDGVMLLGPSGAPIWNSPAVDEERGLIFVGTGESTSEPAHKNTDAIIAIDLNDGSIRWSFQATANDIFVMGCGRSGGLNCPKPEDTVMRDVDFGASMILGERSDGSRILLAGQKSGTVWALNPDSGELIWRQDFGVGSPLGGIHWGIAYDGKHVYAPINRPAGFGSGPTEQKPGIHAVNVDDGTVAWTFAAEPDCDEGRKQTAPACSSNYGLSGAPTVIDGAVVSGSLDGLLRVFDSTTGEVLYKFDTAKKFKTLNGVEANGGAIDNASIVATNGLLFVNSGYGMFGQAPGNVLLAFKPKQ
ncbi:outer membrane protein assembly factor BamB family protein [Aurantivibrio infirmus]